MSERPSTSSRREFLSTSGRVAAASVLAGMVVPRVHAAEDNTIRLALVGCGSRGTGAVCDALATPSGPLQLVAMADAFADRVRVSHDNLASMVGEQMDVPEERRFVGLDAYRKAMDCLRPGDVAILATPPAFRWVHFDYAIQKGLNLFMEKPLTVDGPTSRKMLASAEESEKKNLKVGVGLMNRHSASHRALFEKIQEGQIGQIAAMRAYRMHEPLNSFASERKPAGVSEVAYQIQRFHSFLWASGGCFSDFYIHNIDECCWMKNAWPVEAQALGGRHYRGDSIDQNFDNYSVEYTFADGAKFFFFGRCMNGCQNQFASYAHGTGGSALISAWGHGGAGSKTFSGQNLEDKAATTWAFSGKEPSPYQLEWRHLIEAIRSNTPYNEARRGIEASLVTSMGRMAAHTGQIVTYDQMLQCEHEFAPTVAQLTLDGPAPLVADATGRYPVPQPGLVTRREY